MVRWWSKHTIFWRFSHSTIIAVFSITQKLINLGFWVFLFSLFLTFMNKSVVETSTNNELFVWSLYVLIKHFMKSVKNWQQLPYCCIINCNPYLLLTMDNFNFKEELEDQKKELVEQYGEQIAAYHWNGEDFYDGEYCNPPSYRWSSHLVTVCWSHTVSWIFYQLHVPQPVEKLSQDL